MQGGHIRIIRTAINQGAHTKDLGVELFQHGLNGGRVPTVLEGKSKWGDLGGTMQALIEKEAPTVIVIYLGINDVWHGSKGTTKPDFEAGLKQMVAMSKKAGATVILCTPSVIGEKLQGNKFSGQLDEYAAIIRKLAADEGVALCDIHEAFLAELKRVNVDNQNKGNLTNDGVHMNKVGNTLLADQISQCLVRTLKERNSAKAKANPASLAPSSVPPK
jgi:lysophospholipase L1-like esterase